MKSLIFCLSLIALLIAGCGSATTSPPSDASEAGATPGEAPETTADDLAGPDADASGPGADTRTGIGSGTKDAAAASVDLASDSNLGSDNGITVVTDTIDLASDAKLGSDNGITVVTAADVISTADSGQPQPSPPNAASPLGTNLATISYWSTEWPLVDLFKTSGGWYTQNWDAWDTQEPLDLDANGWVKSLPSANSPLQYRWVAALILGVTAGTFPDGQYVVLYDGEGVLTYDFDAKKNDALSTPGRDIIDVKLSTDGGVLLRITQTNPQNYLRNIRVLMPGIDETQRFHPKFLKDISRFKVLRFMAMLATTDNPPKTWAERPKMSDARYSSNRGVPIELTLEMANAVKADPWINIPWYADDAYVQKFAQLAFSMLGKTQKIYVEYNNEVWNWAYPYNIAGDWIEAQGKKAWPNSAAQDYFKRLNWYARRTIEICTIWKSAFGVDSARVKCVLAGQAGWVDLNKEILDCPIVVANGGAKCSSQVDAFAVAPYFGDVVGADQLSHVTQLMSMPDGGWSQLLDVEGPQRVADAITIMQENAALAKSRGLPLIAYEGGQHYVFLADVWDNAATKNFFVEANRQAQMRQLYDAYLAGWRQSGGQLFVHCCTVASGNSKYGSWGIKEHQSQELGTSATPKWDAIIDFVTNNACWWSGCDK